MSFVDPAFLFSFLPITLVLFALAGRLYGPSGGCAVLILASIMFCVPYGWPFVGVMIVSALVNQAAFAALVRPSNLERSGLRFRVFLGTVIFNLGLLIALKYGALFDAIPGAAALFAALAAVIPASISFFTFQRTVMLFDAYQKSPQAVEFSAATPANKLRLGAFSLMFPNLIIGPIAYLSEIGPQLYRTTFGRLRITDLQVGLTIMTIGLGKKVLLADPLNSNIVVPVFSALHAGRGILPGDALMAMLGFYAQLYFDFSGYSDIAIGTARLFGLELPINFNSPLRASGIVDFWKRWHITLTRVVARLLFTPLAVTGTRFAMRRGFKGGRFKLFASWLPFLANFIVIGLWHGARWTYLVFGFYHAVWFILETEVRLTRRWKAFVKQTSPRLRLRAGQMLAFVPLLLGFALFRSESLQDFAHLLGGLANHWANPAGELLSTRVAINNLVVAFGIAWLCPNVYEFLQDVQPGIMTWTLPSTTPRWFRLVWRPNFAWATLLLVLSLFVIGALRVPTPFAYGGF
jgi:alginate O-acetyltransferase complex protein AlgI